MISHTDRITDGQSDSNTHTHIELFFLRANPQWLTPLNLIMFDIRKGYGMRIQIFQHGRLPSQVSPLVHRS